ncbi:MAG: VOC family protein [Candidatus Paceibacterota bacterium]
MQKIIPHLWLNKNAEEAVAFYTSIFNNGKILGTAAYTEAGQEIHQMKPGSIMSINFEIEGFEFITINGGSIFTINPSISFMVHYTDKDAIGELWEKLLEGGKTLMPLDAYPFSEKYGWVQDKYGVSWQIMLGQGTIVQTIMPSLMYTQRVAGKAEEAINLYTSTFRNGEVKMLARYPAGMPDDKEGTLMYSDFLIEGQMFAAMDSAGKHAFTFSEGVSLLVNCEDQTEIDRLWEALSVDPEAEQCGWMKDKYGVSWQIVPNIMQEILRSDDTEKKNRVIAAMMPMKKIDLDVIEKAARGE